MNSIRPVEETSKFLVMANDVVNFRLIRSSDDLRDDKKAFNPGMTHQIFGPKENIFGYSDLKINILYTAGRLNQYYSKSYDENITREQGGVDPDNIEEKLNKYEILQHENAATNVEHFEDMVRKDKNFKPFGSKLIEYKKGEKTFELYKASMSDAGFKEWYLRLETFIMWFIDGASYIDTDDDQWDYYVTFEKFKNSENYDQWAVAGFSTVFQFYAYPDMIRPRVSQMMILPPFQKIGLATDVLQTICAEYQSEKFYEITMEDPSEQFQRVRDFIDAKSCENLREFRIDFLDKGFHLAMYSAAREKAKINKKQARRIYEILRYKNTPKYDEEKMKKYRLEIKNRINSPFKNESMRKLRVMIPNGIQLSDEDRKKMLHAEYEELMEQYQKVIDRLEKN